MDRFNEIVMLAGPCLASRRRIRVSTPLSHYPPILTISVGKTSLMNQYVNKRFSNQYKATIGMSISPIKSERTYAE